jgi:hypothetical protein
MEPRTRPLPQAGRRDWRRNCVSSLAPEEDDLIAMLETELEQVE